MFCLKSNICSPFGEIYNSGFNISFSVIKEPKSGIRLYFSFISITSSNGLSIKVKSTSSPSYILLLISLLYLIFQELSVKILKTSLSVNSI